MLGGDRPKKGEVGFWVERTGGSLGVTGQKGRMSRDFGLRGGGVCLGLTVQRGFSGHTTGHTHIKSPHLTRGVDGERLIHFAHHFIVW